jgi:ribosomal protein S18 acetylase RimI-like enzyme
VTHRIVSEHAGSSTTAAQLARELYAFNQTVTEHVQWEPMLFCLRDDANVLCGGVSGYLWGGWLHVEVLWVREDLRDQGFGRSLLAQAEAHAFDRGCRDVYLTTFGFQAPDFYRELGYRCAGELANYPHGSNYYFLHKHLDG